MTYNFSTGIDYHTQRNNELIPHKSCGATSMIMALKQAGWELPVPDSRKQPEDYLTEQLLSDETKEKMKDLAPWAYDRDGSIIVQPNEVHAMIRWVVNRLLGNSVDRFSTRFSIVEICEHLLSGGGAILSGVFPIESGDLNHIVSLAGFVSDRPVAEPLDLSQVVGFIIDDPYGNWQTSYRDFHGNDMRLDFQEFIQLFKPTGHRTHKWAHLVDPRGAAG